jgi:glycerol uptake facilitator-like aquaporin
MSDVKPSAPAAWRPLLAELLGTALLVTVVVGSGIAAARLSPSDGGLQLLENSTATVFGLAVLILVFGPVSGGHFNPVISAVDWLLTRRRPGNGLAASGVAMYAAVQLIGAILGALLANIMFDLPALQISGRDRITLGHGLGEVVATAGLVLLDVCAYFRTVSI